MAAVIEREFAREHTDTEIHKIYEAGLSTRLGAIEDPNLKTQQA
jgi:hypothetical protein